MDLSDIMLSLPVIAKWTPDPFRGTLSLGTFGDPSTLACRLVVRLEYLESGRRCPLMQLLLIPPTADDDVGGAQVLHALGSRISFAYPANNIEENVMGPIIGRSDDNPAETTAAIADEIDRLSALDPSKHFRAAIMDIAVATDPIMLKPRHSNLLASSQVSEQLDLFKELISAKKFSLHLVYNGILHNDVRHFCKAISLSKETLARSIDTETHVAVQQPGLADWNNVVAKGKSRSRTSKRRMMRQIASAHRRLERLSAKEIEVTSDVHDQDQLEEVPEHRPIHGKKRSVSVEADAMETDTMMHDAANRPAGSHQAESEPGPQGSRHEQRLAHLRSQIELTVRSMRDSDKGKAATRPDQESARLDKPPEDPQQATAQPPAKRIRSIDGQTKQMANDFSDSLPDASGPVSTTGEQHNDVADLPNSDDTMQEAPTDPDAQQALTDQPAVESDPTTTTAAAAAPSASASIANDNTIPITAIHHAIALSGPPTEPPTDDDNNAIAAQLPSLWHRWAAWTIVHPAATPEVVGPVLREMFGAAMEGDVGGFVGGVVGILGVLAGRGVDRV